MSTNLVLEYGPIDLFIMEDEFKKMIDNMFASGVRQAAEHFNIANDLQQKVADLFVSNKTRGCCFIASILLAEMLDKRNMQCFLVQGWWFSDKYMGRHYWVELYDRVYDTGTIVLKQLVPTFPSISLSRDKPLHRRRIDDESDEEKQDLLAMESQFKLYVQTEFKNVIQDAPLFVKTFCKRNKLLT